MKPRSHDHDHDHDHDHAGHDHDHASPDHVGHDHAGHDHDHAGHDHDHAGHDHARELRSSPLTRLVTAFTITATFMVVEAAVGWFSKSLSLVADAGHMLADAAALGLAIVAQRLASGPRTRARTYGSRRAEVLAAFANGVALALTAIWIFIEAVERFRTPLAINGRWMMIGAVGGLVVNLVSAAVLSVGSKGHNINTRGALTHVLADALGSVGAIVAGALVLGFGMRRADPVISAVIAVLVLWGGYRLVRDTSRVLMEGSPFEIDVAHVEETLRSVPGVAGFHDLHVWSISEGFDVLTVHVILARGHRCTEVVDTVAARLRERHGLTHCTIQPEPLAGDELVVLRVPNKR